jgi:hypothetical protein
MRKSHLLNCGENRYGSLVFAEYLRYACISAKRLLHQMLESLPKVFSLSGQRSPNGRARMPGEGKNIIGNGYKE